MKRCLLFLTVLFAFSGGLCHGEEPRKIEWPDLTQASLAASDPLADMSEEDAGFVEWIIYLRQYLPETIDPVNKDFYDEMNQAIPELMKKGIDVDKIIADRERMNTAVNKELDGKLVTLSGYLLPLDLSSKKITDFLLVPYIGACIHAPPPPPNQILHAVSSTTVDYELERLFIPVTVTGTLKIESLSKNLFLVDGSSNIDIGYTMKVEKIEEYRK